MNDEMCRKAKAALEELGTTADEAARSLEKRGIRGFREEAGSCPLTRHLADACQTGNVWVEESKIIVEGCTLKIRPLDEDHRLPEWVPEFVKTFDRGGYPELDQKKHEDEQEALYGDDE